MGNSGNDTLSTGTSGIQCHY
ncbi:hypothetical protein [Nostoc sp.]